MDREDLFVPVVFFGLSLYLTYLLSLDYAPGGVGWVDFMLWLGFFVGSMFLGLIIYGVMFELLRGDVYIDAGSIVTILAILGLPIIYVKPSLSFIDATASLNLVYTADFLKYLGLYIVYYLMKLLTLLGIGAPLYFALDLLTNRGGKG